MRNLGVDYMSIVYVCDRCKKQFDMCRNRNRFVLKQPKHNPAFKIMGFMVRDDWVESEFELCDECRDDFINWFMMRYGGRKY